jgi:hypothetical protein
MRKQCRCGFKFTRQVKVFPFHCQCGRKYHEGEVEADTRGYDHAAICRSGQCGRYLPESDACGVLVQLGKAGHVAYLYSHPTTRCAAPEGEKLF